MSLLKKIIRKVFKQKSDVVNFALRLNNDKDFRFFGSKSDVEKYLIEYAKTNEIFNYQLFEITFKSL